MHAFRIFYTIHTFCVACEAWQTLRDYLYFVRRLSVRLSVRHTFSSHFFVTLSNNFFLLEGLDWNFIQMFISICVMDTQKGNNPKIFYQSYCPFFCWKLTYTMLTIWLRGDRAFIFHMCIACDNNFPNLVYFLTL